MLVATPLLSSVQLLPKSSVPIVRAESRWTVLLRVLKSAVPSIPSATAPPNQLAVLDQRPPLVPSVHVPFVPAKERSDGYAAETSRTTPRRMTHEGAIRPRLSVPFLALAFKTTIVGRCIDEKVRLGSFAASPMKWRRIGLESSAPVSESRPIGYGRKPTVGDDHFPT